MQTAAATFEGCGPAIDEFVEGVFLCNDENADGAIDRSETAFVWLLQEQFKELDLNGDGGVTKQELKKCLTSYRAPDSP